MARGQRNKPVLAPRFIAIDPQQRRMHKTAA
jgi:hypothetical protein